MDSIVFEESINTEVSTSEFVDKQWLYVVDNNNGSYSSQIVLDTTPLANSGSYINWSEAFILMPLLLQIESTALGDLGTIGDFIIALKNGYWNMLHSLTCEFNNGNIIQQVPFLNVFCSFKNLTSWSQEDVLNWGSVCGFFPDTARSWAYCAANPATANNVLGGSGNGLTNNRNAPFVSITAATTTGAVATPILYNLQTPAYQLSSDIRQGYNAGLFERQTYFNYNPIVQAVGANNFSNNQGALISAGNCATIFRSYVNGGEDYRYFQIDAIIRLKDITDFFQKCPLLKGSTMRIYLNVNQTYFATTQTSATFTNATGVIASQPFLTMTSTPVILGGGGTNPIIYASNALGQGSSVLTPLIDATTGATTATTKVAVSIVRNQFSTNFAAASRDLSCPITNVRLYAPAYVMSPIAEQRYLSLSPQKRVLYNDIFQFNFSNQISGSTFNILVSNGIPNVRSVLVIPLLPAASNGAVPAGSVATSTLLSPFTTTPATPDPIALTNFQIQVSGKNLFNNQQQYDFENFVEQLGCSNQLNGNLTTSMTSGLISKRDFQSLYRYYYGNVSRSLPSEDGVAKAIQILGTVASPVAVDLMVFVEFEREITIDTRTGARIM